MNEGDHLIWITANERLSRYLHHTLKPPQSVWASPPIVSLQHWYRNIYSHCLRTLKDVPRLLTPLQSRTIWSHSLQSILAERQCSFLSPERMVDELETAFERALLWELDWRDSLVIQTPESELFQSCVEKVLGQCQKKGWLLPAQLPAYLNQSDLSNAYPPKTCLILFGFQELPPLSLRLLNKFQAYDVDWQQKIPSPKVASLYCYQAPDRVSEYIAIAEWAALRLKKGHSSIACVIPDLAQYRTLIKRIFNQVFYPDFLLESEPWDAPFNISVGESLIDQPLIQTILSILNLYPPAEPLYSHFSSLLLSPFIEASQTEALARKKLDFQLRHKVFSHFQPLRAQLDEWETTIPLFVQAYRKNPQIPPQFKQSIGDWLKWLNQLLTDWGWPGERDLTSKEFQVLAKWQQALDELLNLDLCEPFLNFTRFLTCLQYQLSQTTFQVETQVAPIQILGMLEASGAQYDAIWIANLSDNRWPNKASPSPYLPYQWQKSKAMPHSDNQREYRYSQEMMTEWGQSAETVCFSYFIFEDNIEYEPSPLLIKLERPFISIEAKTMPAYLALPPLDKRECYSELKILPIEKLAELQPDARLVDRVVQCPFQAFAYYRLGVRPYPSLETHGSPRLRGILLHKILEKIWGVLKTQATLNGLSKAERTHLIKKVSEATLKQYLSTLPQRQQRTYIELALTRIETEIMALFSLEEARPPFMIHQLEEKFSFSWKGLSFTVKLDRIDKISADHYLLIDYKSSERRLQNWFKSPLQDTQLLLYYLSLQLLDSSFGFLILPLRGKAPRFCGLGPEDVEIEGIQSFPIIQGKQGEFESWSDLLAFWQNQLDEKINTFIEGDVRIQPLNPNDCDHCGLFSLCRIHEQ